MSVCAYVYVHACTYEYVCCVCVLLKAQISNKYMQYRAAAWIGYYQLLPDIIGYFPYNFKIWVAKMYGNNGTFYGGTTI